MANNMSDNVKAVSGMVNAMCFDDEGFCMLMQREHRTLQQSFTRLCLAWIKFVASSKYQFDGRNEAAHEMCKGLLESAEKGGFDTRHLNLPMV